MVTELSPAAQAIKDAVLALYADENVHQFGWQLDAPTVAAALRAAADQVVPKELASLSKWPERYEVRRQLLAISTELEKYNETV